MGKTILLTIWLMVNGEDYGCCGVGVIIESMSGKWGIGGKVIAYACEIDSEWCLKGGGGKKGRWLSGLEQ